MDETVIEQSNDFVCRNCGNTLPTDSNENTTQLCESCRNQFLKLRIPLWVLISAAVIFIFVMYQGITTLPKGIEYRKAVYQAEKAYDDKHYAIALINFEKAENLGFLDSEGDSHQFIAYVRNYEYDKAETIYDEQLVGTETSNDALYNDIQSAVNELNDYYEISDTFDQLLNDSGDLSLDDLIARVEAYIKISPDEYYAHSILSDLYFEKGEYQKSINELNEVMRIKPSLSSVTNISLAGSYRQLGEFDKAYEALDQALDQNKDDISAMCSYARTLIKEKKYQESLTYLENINPLLTNDPYYTESLAMAYHFNGMSKERDLLVTQLQEVDQYDTTFLLEVINNQTDLYN